MSFYTFNFQYPKLPELLKGLNTTTAWYNYKTIKIEVLIMSGDEGEENIVYR